MLTKQDLINKIDSEASNYPEVAALKKAQDPRVMQTLDAMATMLAMLSQQIEVASTELFDKARESTILADAAMHGIIRIATPAQVKLLVKNENLVPVQIIAGTTLLDSSGNKYVVTSPATIPESTLVSTVYVPGEGYINAEQYYLETYVETATRSEDFYAVAIPEADDNSYLAGFSVSVSGDDYEYRDRFINVLPGDAVYSVEYDDKGQPYIRFGVKNSAGKAIAAGDVITVQIKRSVGKVKIKVDSPFSFEYLTIQEDSEIDWRLVDLSMSEVIVKGDNPLTIQQLKELCKYPSIYDDSAVYLGEFEFLIRRKYPNLDFLSVWNESIEEVARGAGSLDNINTLFVACYDGLESTLDQPDNNTPVDPTVITTLIGVQEDIKSTLLKADNSYKVTFYTPVTSKIAVTVVAKISTAHVVDTVTNNIKQTLLTAFGKDAGNHNSKPLQRLAYALLQEKIPELTVGNAYLKIDVEELSGAYRPELWRYMTADSIIVTVTQTNIALPGFGS